MPSGIKTTSLRFVKSAVNSFSVKRKFSRLLSFVSFFGSIKKRHPRIFDIVKDIYDWSQTEADRIRFGIGKETGSISFYYIKDGEIISVFSLLTTGKFVLNYGAF